MTERVELYLWQVSHLMVDEETIISIGTHLDVDQSVIDSCLTDNPGNIQLAGYKLLMEWKQPIQTNDINALRSRLQHGFEENNMLGPFLNINMETDC